ncbi:Asp23/Gls24 family envelope stress response protein [Fusibacter ferrireducens]|uniref:Asp23/Gls24 family envelope stress response protein n=1 Tax=Fusibacter ferrireducens TaxID=2785058 RepID=A0ABR9ZMJ9_9FIRM|nr:Asp23/Gls24 family envelope stress response protein [Fusibacter ferrireducens]MBF4691682.1 Asp23/Gls24 family envelope stress response protein [Fusibacter ferrireducens]
MSIKIQNELGDVIIDADVVSTIAGLAAMECYGLVGMTYKSARSGLAKILKGEHLSKGVEVTVEETGVIVTLYVIIQFGTKISVVAENIIEKVKYNVENLTGLNVLEVNLNIEGVRVQE